MIHTIEDAYAFVREVKICTIFGQKTGHASLWDHIDLPDRRPGDKGWGQKVTAVTYEHVRLEPEETGPLRNLVLSEYDETKSQFDTAFKELQIWLNVVRSNGPHVKRDTWVTFEELYPEIWDPHVTGD